MTMNIYGVNVKEIELRPKQEIYRSRGLQKAFNKDVISSAFIIFSLQKNYYV